MKAIAIALAGSALAAGLVLGLAEAPPAPTVVEGKDKPILLARVVVTATALPAEAR